MHRHLSVYPYHGPKKNGIKASRRFVSDYQKKKKKKTEQSGGKKGIFAHERLRACAYFRWPAVPTVVRINEAPTEPIETQEGLIGSF